MWVVFVTTRERAGLYVADDENLSHDLTTAAKYETEQAALDDAVFIDRQWDHEGPLTILKVA